MSASKILDTDNQAFSSSMQGTKRGLDTNISGPLTAFGEVAVAESTPVVQYDAIYGIRTYETETFTGIKGY